MVSLLTLPHGIAHAHKIIMLKKFLSQAPYKNSLYIVLSKSSFVVAAFCISVMAAKKLGLHGFGVYSLVFSLYMMFELIVTLGVDNIVIRETASDHSKAKIFFTHGAAIGILSSLVCFFLLIMTGQFMQYPNEIKIAILQMGNLLFPSFLYFLLEALLIALQRPKDMLVGALCRDVSAVGMGAFILSAGGGLYGLIEAMFIARFIGLTVLLHFFSKQYTIEWSSSIDLSFLKKFLKLIPTFFGIGILAGIFLEIDTIVLSKFLSIPELGLYTLAKRIMRVGNVFYYSVVTAFFPLISQVLNSNKERLALFRRIKWTLGILIVSLILIALITAPFVIRIFFGREYLPAVSYLQILIWAWIPLSLALLTSRFLIAGHKQDKDLLSVILGLVCLIISGICFSLKWQGMGMAVAFVLSSCVVALASYCFAWKLLRYESK
jgi:O-antigen/teichoic acid export membrane protein